MKISVVIAVYNAEQTIRDTLDSLCKQTHTNIELIVIDGASTDRTIQILNEYTDKIDILISEPDVGIYDALNKGIKHATGDVLGFLHSDDVYASDNVLGWVAGILSGKDIDGCYGDLVYTSKKDTSRVIRYWKSKEFYIGLLKKGWMPPHPTLFLKKEVYEEYGGFDLEYKIAADYDFMLRVLQGGIRVKYIPETLYKMRVGGESNKSLSNIIRKSREDLRALKKNNIGGFNALCIKNISKISQFLNRR